MDLIVSRVNGSFGGLGGATVIELEDGTEWKQANADDRFRGSPVDHPALPSSAAFLVIRCGLKACRSFTSIRSHVETIYRGEAIGKDSI